MSTDARSFKAPFIEKEQCWEAADRFRQNHWTADAIPVDVLEIAEFELDLEIRSVASLKSVVDIDALLLGDWTTIIVDQQQYLEDRFLNRLRFSVAHELGHFALHREVYKQIRRDTIDEWITFMKEMPE